MAACDVILGAASEGPGRKGLSTAAARWRLGASLLFGGGDIVEDSISDRELPLRASDRVIANLAELQRALEMSSRVISVIRTMILRQNRFSS
jgi:hypothetical protein